MQKRFKVSPLENSTILRKFSILFFSMSVIPLGLIFYFYYTIREYDFPGNKYIIPFLLVIVGVCIGYWGMRVVLKDLVKVVKIHSASLENLLGFEKMKELTEGKSEIDVLARTFDEVIYQLEENVRKLELTKKTLHSVLNRIGDGLSSIEDINSFLTLIVETIADAFNAKIGVLMLVDEQVEYLSLKVGYGVDLSHKINEKIYIKNGTFGSVLIKKEPHFILDFIQDDIPESLRDIFTSPVLCAPLLFQDKLLGIIAP